MTQQPNPDAVATYLKGGAHCPFCQMPCIEGDAIEVDDGGAFQEIRCFNEKCQQEWTDCYTLTGIVVDGVRLEAETPPTLTPRELATVLAALRTVQQDIHVFKWNQYKHFDEHEPLTSDEIDALCERLNS